MIEDDLNNTAKNLEETKKLIQKLDITKDEQNIEKLLEINNNMNSVIKFIKRFEKKLREIDG